MKSRAFLLAVVSASLPTSVAIAGPDYLRIDTTNKLEVAWAYRNLLKKAEVTNPGWTGSVSGCVVGATDAWAQLKTIQAVNWFRAMSGVAADETLYPAASPAMQAAAVAIVASGDVQYSGGSPNVVAAYTACADTNIARAGIQGSTKGYLEGVATNVATLNRAMQSYGVSNWNIGILNRQWLLDPMTSKLGVGLVSDQAGSAAVIYRDNSGTLSRYTLSLDLLRSWPRPGYFPGVDNLAPSRWHLMNEQGFAATGSATVNGLGVPAKVYAYSTPGPWVTSYTMMTINDGAIDIQRGGPLGNVSGDSEKVITAQFNDLWQFGSFSRSHSRSLSVRFFDPWSLDSNIIESGWYWQPSDGGNGTSIEQQGDRVFLSTYTYRSDGSPIWYVGNCTVTIGAQTCSGQLQEFAGGKTVLADGGQAAQVGAAGGFSLTWSAKDAVTMTYPGGTLDLVRYKPKGGDDQGSVPQTGWWWERGPGGEGIFIEVSGSYMYAAFYAYDAAGQPTWYVANGDMSADRLRLENAALLTCQGGRSLAMAPGSRPLPSNGCTQVGNITMTFTGTDKSQVQISSGGASRTFTVDRFWFNAGSLAQ